MIYTINESNSVSSSLLDTTLQKSWCFLYSLICPTKKIYKTTMDSMRDKYKFIEKTFYIINTKCSSKWLFLLDKVQPLTRRPTAVNADF